MSSAVMALGGITAALAVVIFSIGGIVPASTYICPALCCFLLQMIKDRLGVRGCWVWYTCVGLLALLVGPDKEAAAVFIFLGSYPIIRPSFPKGIIGLTLKLLYFNAVTVITYQLLIHLFGMAAVANEFEQLGTVMTLITLGLGNLLFILLDRTLRVLERKIQNE